MTSLTIERKVNSYDRDMYNTWTNSWKMPKDIIDYAITLAKGKSSPMQYLNQILSTWHNADVKTLADAKAYKSTPTQTTTAKADNKVMTRSYTTEELNSLFDNLDEVEI